MEWFKHMANTSNDAKVKKLILRHGAEGYAVYFHCLELITNDINANNITFQLEHDAEIIADNLRIKAEPNLSPIEKTEQIMKTIVELKLFESDEGYITCFKLARSLSQSMTSSPKMRTLISQVKQEHHDGIMTASRNSHARIEEKRIDKNKKDIKKDTKKEKTFNPKDASKEHSWIDNELWAEWIDKKRKLKLAVTERAINKNLNTLKKLGEGIANKIIEQTLDFGYKDFYPLKSNDLFASQKNKHEQPGQVLRSSKDIQVSEFDGEY